MSNMTGLATYLKNIGDTEDWVEVIHQISKGIVEPIDLDQLDIFKKSNGHVPKERIATFDLHQCKTLAHVICRILYWNEPPIFSIDGHLGVIEPEPFAFEDEVRALAARTLELLSETS
jgi:hypothetical protein